MFGLGSVLKRFVASLTRQERVVEVNGSTVVTEVDGQRCTYRECQGTYHVGDVIEEPIKHRFRSYQMAWSPWDEPEDD